MKKVVCTKTMQKKTGLAILVQRTILRDKKDIM